MRRTIPLEPVFAPTLSGMTLMTLQLPPPSVSARRESLPRLLQRSRSLPVSTVRKVHEKELKLTFTLRTAKTTKVKSEEVIKDEEVDCKDDSFAKELLDDGDDAALSAEFNKFFPDGGAAELELMD
jgi:hypothetical protein